MVYLPALAMHPVLNEAEQGDGKLTLGRGNGEFETNSLMPITA